MKCCVDDCENNVYRLGIRKCKKIDLTTKYCRKHYRWLNERGSLEPTKMSQMSPEKRFWRYVEKKGKNECWEWLGVKSYKGYGRLFIGNGKTTGAHRFSYNLVHNDLTDADYVLHSCDNPACVNPNHLRKGTQSENIKEAFEKGRKTQPIMIGENNPKSKLTIEQVKFIKANPQLGHKHIADMFGLSPNCIRGVRIGRTWKEVQ